MKTPFRATYAKADGWALAAKACVENIGPISDDINFGFLYISDDLVEDASSILTFLRQKTGIPHWVGASGVGIIAQTDDFFEQGVLTIMVGAFPPDSFKVFPSLDEEEVPADLMAWAQRRTPVTGLIHADGDSEFLPEQMQALSDEAGAFLLGGFASARGDSALVADEVTKGGMAGVLFDPQVGVAAGLSQGCVPIGAAHVVSDAIENVLVGLDGRPALEVFKEDVGETIARDLKRAGGLIQAAIPIEGSDTGDFMVRGLLGIDPQRGWIAIGQDIQVGERVMFAKRDSKIAREDMRRMLTRLKARLDADGTPIRAAIYVSCLGRGPGMFADGVSETELIEEILGDFPMIGTYAGGEISGGRIYSYTGVLTLFI
ncbi:FIST signal transduction protein [Varunaivibrio sulfuroxidans]|uniref:Small ligand-binding sensory domain FIST n=1 Tax=Varunaivibrio sulfuroxidans TaxID=1773489 RepID=A0A4V2UP77_9PROT|nr:FIST N-terminal domain-containing protein [Varunaivibrio sulfuroxidans]TCS64801.1 small ligand-binding sensory domain FIST [Varunaivibrio sulfuroxidans]WES29896.1 FIST C-terminal domain-containing protein [Varunaivibrio sulfuroxidans]